MDLSDYLRGDRLTAELLESTPPINRKVILTSECVMQSFDTNGSVDRKPLLTVVFNGKKTTLKIGVKMARAIAKELGSSNTEDWKDAVVDLDTEKRGMYHYIVVKAVYSPHPPPPKKVPANHYNGLKSV